MTLIFRTTYVETVRRVQGPVRTMPQNNPNLEVVSDVSRYQSISSLQAPGLAVAGSAMAPSLLWLVL